MNERTQLESETSPQVVQALEASGCHVFRNNRGVARFGPRFVHYGVGPNGAGDFIGFLPVRITEAMVGHYVAIFVSAETKRPIGASYQSKQFEWRDMVLAAGGAAGIAHRWEDGRAIVTNWFERFKTKTTCVRKHKKVS